MNLGYCCFVAHIRPPRDLLGAFHSAAVVGALFCLLVRTKMADWPIAWQQPGRDEDQR